MLNYNNQSISSNTLQMGEKERFIDWQSITHREKVV